MKIEDMHTAFACRSHHVIGTMDNKIVLETATDPANYDVEEWDPELCLAKYRLVLRRHEAMPRGVRPPRLGRSDHRRGSDFRDHLHRGRGALHADISDQGLIPLTRNSKSRPAAAG